VQQVLEEARFRELFGSPLDPGSTHVFLCGNPEMIQSVRDVLAPRGFTPGTAAAPGNVHFEKYW
jgi:ferredoxin--NADP+ reductase